MKYLIVIMMLAFPLVGTGQAYEVISHPTDQGGPVNIAPGGGTFDGTDGWTTPLGNGWTISGGEGHVDGSPGNNYLLDDNNILTVGKTYTGEITISNYSAGNLRVRFGSVLAASALWTSNGTKTFEVVADDVRFRIQGVGFNGTVDDLVIYEQ